VLSPHGRRAEPHYSLTALRLRSSVPTPPRAAAASRRDRRGVRGFYLITDRVSERHFPNLAREVRLLSAPIREGRIDCGWAHATDQSRWSPGINASVPIDLSDNCYLIHHSSEGYLLWDTGITDRLAALPEGQTVPAQGRVRSDNIAARQHDGLLFRSRPEILFYDALKKAGIPFAPLSVVLRGGVQYNRIEPDFVIYKDGIMMIVEIDGDLYHSETPAAAHARRSVRGAGVTLRFRASSQWTRCWRKEDSNSQSLPAARPPVPWSRERNPVHKVRQPWPCLLLAAISQMMSFRSSTCKP
jgi:hypothetical protein